MKTDELKNAWDLLKTVDWMVGDDLERRVHAYGGWRTFFDLNAHQWKMSTLDEKIGLLRDIMKATGTSLGDIVHLYNKDYGADRPDLAHGVQWALMTLLDHTIRMEES